MVPNFVDKLTDEEILLLKELRKQKAIILAEIQVKISHYIFNFSSLKITVWHLLVNSLHCVGKFVV